MNYISNYINIVFEQNVDDILCESDEIYNTLINDICKDKITKDYYQDINDSIKYESDEPLSIDNIDKIFSYLKSVEIPKISELYSLLKYDDYKRDVFVGISPHYIGQKTVWKHCGIHPNSINYNELQKMVNSFYKKIKSNKLKYIDKLILGFVYYLVYEKIHPHNDGNGRIGRLLFIENPFNNIYFPISTSLKNSLSKSYINRLYKKFNICYKCFTNCENNFNNYPVDYLYLNTIIDVSIIREIMNCIVQAIVYKYLYKNTYNNYELIFKILNGKIGEKRIIEYYESDILDKFDYQKYKDLYSVYNNILKLK